MPVGARECSRTYSRPSGDFEAPCEAFTSFEKGAEAMAPAGVSLWTLCPVEGADVARIERFPAVFQGAARARTQCNGSPGGHNPARIIIPPFESLTLITAPTRSFLRRAKVSTWHHKPSWPGREMEPATTRSPSGQIISNVNVSIGGPNLSRRRPARMSPLPRQGNTMA
jgi:hypothetical protein